MFRFKNGILQGNIGFSFILLVSAHTPGTADPRLINLPEKCFDDLGCFSNGPPFFDLFQRPIFPLPDDEIVALFLLYNRKDSAKFKYLEPDENSLRNSGFDPSLKTKVIVHGYNHKIEEKSSLMKLKNTLLNLGDSNVIFVNWTQSASKPFPQAVANGRVVGAMIARLLRVLNVVGKAPLETMHIICHSLGCHVSGWAGEGLNGLGRITALDPGGPYFYSAPTIVRLDPTDAHVVDVIHTNAGRNILQGLGRIEETGHFDCYPNGGSLQPGCGNIIGRAGGDHDTTARLLPQISFPDACSHDRAIVLFNISVNSTCKFTCVACDSWEKYKKGECDQRERYEMGYHAVKPKGDTTKQKFYVKTTGKPPFCTP